MKKSLKYLFLLSVVPLTLSSCEVNDITYHNNHETGYHYSAEEALHTVQIGLKTPTEYIEWGQNGEVALSLGHNISDENIQKEYASRIDNILLYFSSKSWSYLELNDVYDKESEDYKNLQEEEFYFIKEIDPSTFFSEEYLYTYSVSSLSGLDITYTNEEVYSFPCNYLVGEYSERNRSRSFYFTLVLVIKEDYGYGFNKYGASFSARGTDWLIKYSLTC